MNLNHKTSAMLFLSALCLVFSVLFVSSYVPHCDSTAPCSASVTHFPWLNVDGFALIQLDQGHANLFTAVKQIGSLDSVTHSQTYTDSIILLPFFISLVGDAFAPFMLINYQLGVQVYLSHQQHVWQNIKRQRLLPPFSQQYEPLVVFPNSIFA
jgi:hypothetical protein